MLAKRLGFIVGVLWSPLLMGRPLKTIAQDNALVKYADSDDRLPGICRETAQAVTAVDPELTFRGLEHQAPLVRIEKMLEQGIIDVFFCFLHNRQRAERFRYIDIPLYKVQHVLLVKADDPIVINSYDDLSNKGIVLVNYGSSLVRDLNEAGVKNFASAKNDAQLIRMLDSGRGRFIYGQDLTLIEMLRRLNLKDRYRILPVVLKEEYQYLTYHANLDPALVKKLEAAIQSLSQSGKLQAIVSRYRS